MPTAEYTVRSNKTVKDAIEKMDQGGIGIVVVVNDDDIVMGIITDGDFRRSVLKGIDLHSSVMQIINTEFKYLKKGYPSREANNFFKRETQINHLLILDDGKLTQIIKRKDFYKDKVKRSRLHNRVVIMAGGKGVRLDPFTRILPKPLIPIGDKTIIELIMDKYMEYGIDHFIITVNYKARMIKTYLEDCNNDYTITYIDEGEPLGTAGSLRFVEKTCEEALFVANCDVLIKDNYAEIFKYHCDGNFDLTMVACLKSYVIPYGVCEIDRKGNLTQLNEKPESSFLVNTGMYLLSPGIVETIPPKQVYHMTDLIDNLQKQGLKVGVYPISENSYIDIGQWELYRNTVNIFDGRR